MVLYRDIWLAEMVIGCTVRRGGDVNVVPQWKKVKMLMLDAYYHEIRI
jgi:hypothetical protein